MGFAVCNFRPTARIDLLDKVSRKHLEHIMDRRTFLQFAGAAVAAPAFPKLVTAQTWPTRPITMIDPFAAGAISDVVCRILAERMRSPLGQPVIIENIAGAEGNIGVGRAARAKPDGYTVVYGTSSTHVLNGAFYSLPYDVFNDFAPIAPLATSPLVLFARKTMPAKDLSQFISWLRANPGKASAGIVASSLRLLAASFEKETGTRFTFVPYRGGAPAVQDLVAGQIDFLFLTPDQLPLARAGTIKAYAVTGDTRLAVAPEIPTFAEVGLAAVSSSDWGALFAPKGTPQDIIGKLNAAVVEALADPAVQSRIVDLGLGLIPREQQTPEALGALQKADAEKWWPIIKELGIKAQ
jgi:tripartite-type tricarboxylate transporter receptor subunit TctC